MSIIGRILKRPEVLFAPIVIVFVVVFIIPFISTIYYSLTDRDALIPDKSKYVGLANYEKTIQDNMFWNSIIRGAVYSIVSAGFQTFIGLVFALLLQSRMPGRALMKIAVLLPYFIPTIVVATLWRYLFDDSYGLINLILLKLNIISDKIAWLANPSTSLLSAIVMGTWEFMPFAFIIFLAALSRIPLDIYYAAMVDGASRWRCFWDMTLPYLKKTIVLVFFFRAIWMFNKFDVIWLLTKGGPLHSSEHLPIYIYINAFFRYQFGLGSCMAMITFIMLVVLSAAYMSILKPEPTQKKL
ncbi:MAG: sugar ABC transporter permease [candidate division Zixibacteria bacterium]|nr:sugar ABC transporter permease [candidate division Zixibacteria bacterium]